MDLKRHEESNGPNAELGDAFVAQPAAELVSLYGGCLDNHKDHMDGFGYSHPYGLYVVVNALFPAS